MCVLWSVAVVTLLILCVSNVPVYVLNPRVVSEGRLSEMNLLNQFATVRLRVDLLKADVPLD